MRLQLDRALRPQRQRAIPEVLHARAVDHGLSFSQTHVRSPTWTMRRLFHWPKGRSALTRGSLPGRAGRVVEEAARAELRAAIPLAAGLGRVPDLDLRVAAKVDAAVGLGDGAVLEPQLDVAELADRSSRRAPRHRSPGRRPRRASASRIPAGPSRAGPPAPSRDSAHTLRGSTCPRPCQPVRSLPLKSVNGSRPAIRGSGAMPRVETSEDRDASAMSARRRALQCERWPSTIASRARLFQCLGRRSASATTLSA